MELSKTFTFEASHMLHNHSGKCRNLHGHSWVLTAFVEGQISVKTGMVVDYYDIKQAVQPIVDRLDHRHLGNGTVGIRSSKQSVHEEFWLPSTVEGLDLDLPTSENLLYWIAAQIPKNFHWSKLTLNETCTSSATLTWSEYYKSLMI